MGGCVEGRGGEAIPHCGFHLTITLLTLHSDRARGRGGDGGGWGGGGCGVENGWCGV
jgi:hypothetical protein